MTAFFQKLLCSIFLLFFTCSLHSHPFDDLSGINSIHPSSFTLPHSAPDTVHYYYRDTFCSNQSVLINSSIYGPSNPSGTEFLPHAAANGEDSVIHVELIFREPALTQIDQSLCSGDTLWVAGVPYHDHHWLGEETIEKGAANGCDSIIQVNLEILAAPVLSLSDTLCPGDFRLVNGQRYDRDHPNGTEVLSGAAPSGCDSTVVVNLTFLDLQLSAGADQSAALGDAVCLEPTYNFTPAGLSWSPPLPCPDTPCTGGCFTPAGSGIYLLTATDSGSGCTLTDEVAIDVSSEQRLYFPNAFKPGGEALNDHFYLSTGPGVSSVQRLLITDRWGEVVFDRGNFPPNVAGEGWDGRAHGKEAAPGVYAFWVELVALDGTILRQTGSVTLIR